MLPRDGSLQARRDGDAAKQTMLAMKTRQDDLEQRIVTAGQMRERRDDARPVGFVHPVKFADMAFIRASAGIELPFQHALAVRGHVEVDTDAAHNLQRRSEQRPGDVHLVVAEPEIEAGRQHHGRVIADAHGNVERGAPRPRRARHNRQVMVRRNADKGAVSVKRTKARDRHVHRATLCIACDDEASCDVGAVLAFEEAGDGKLGH